LLAAVELFLHTLGITPGRAFAASAAPVAVEFVGPPGAGKRLLAGQIAAWLDAPLLSVDAQRLLAGRSGPQVIDDLHRVARAAHLHGLLLYWRNLGGLEMQLWEGIPQTGPVFWGVTAPTP